MHAHHSIARLGIGLTLLLIAGACGPTDGDGDGRDGGTNDAGLDGGSGSELESQLSIDSGELSGIDDGDLVVFKGVPYAEAPVGSLRFRHPVPVSAWGTPFDATAFGPPCVQRDHTGAMVGDEDCLRINVWAPKAPAAGGRPVMVFIHGGAFIQGSSNLAVYDGASLARTGDVVVMSLQYRLGALGFFVSDGLLAEETGAGNQGIRDQQLALDWVRRNAAAFGGDASQVTIFGESAGGISACVHLGAASSDGLFARAIIQSGTGCYNLQRLRVATPIHVSALTQGDNLRDAAGCQAAPDVLACLRNLPASELIDAGLQTATNGLALPDFGPVIDQVLLTEAPYDRVRRGERSEVSILTGSNADEAKSFTQGLTIANAAAFEAQVRRAFPLQADAVLTLYPVTDFATPKDAYDALLSDVAFICPSLAFAEVAGDAADPGTEVRAYHFTHKLSGLAAGLGSFHALELWFLFGTMNTLTSYTPTAGDQRVSDTMREAWSDFARGQAPLAELPWLPTTTDSPQIGLLADPPSATTEIRGGRCDGLQALDLVRSR